MLWQVNRTTRYINSKIMATRIITISVIITFIFSCERTINENMTCPSQFIVADSYNECVFKLYHFENLFSFILERCH
jgi:hypothetical protein